jgi:hypothetical protein
MVQLKSNLGTMLALLCFLELVTGNPLRLPEHKFTPTQPGEFEITAMVDKRATGVRHHSHIGTKSEEHYSWFTVTGTSWALHAEKGHPTTETNSGIYHSHIGTKSEEHHSW